MQSKFLTATEVATEFFNGSCSYHKVLRLTRSGVLPAVKLGKSYMYSREALVKWAEVNFNRPAYAKMKL